MSLKERHFETMQDGETLEVLNPDLIDDLHPSIKSIINYFWQKAETKARPKRTDLVPSEILPIVPYVSILEPIYENGNMSDIKVRLMGTEMVKVYGEQTGRLVSEINNVAVVKRIFDTCELAVKSKSIVVGTVSSFDEDKSYVKIVKTKIPLFDDEQDPDKVTQLISLVIYRT